MGWAGTRKAQVRRARVKRNGRGKHWKHKDGEENMERGEK